MNNFGYTRQVDTGFLETIDDITMSLKEQGFGVLMSIDIQEKIKEKLGRDIEEYTILGACNPNFASQALDLVYEIGLLLPCNIIVYKKDSKVYVSAILPTVAMSMIENTEMKNIALQVEEKLKKAVDNI